MLVRVLSWCLCFLPLNYLWGQVEITPAPAESPLLNTSTLSSNVPSSKPTTTPEADKDKKQPAKASSYKRYLPWALGITGGILGGLILYRAYPSSSQQSSLPAQTEPKFNLDTAYTILQKPTGNISTDEWGLLESNANLLYTSSRDLALKVGLLKKNEQVFSLVYINPQDSRFLQLITISKYLNYRRHKSLENKPSLPHSFWYMTGLNVDGKFDLKRSHVSLIKELFIESVPLKEREPHPTLLEAQKLYEKLLLDDKYKGINTELKYLEPDRDWLKSTILPQDLDIVNYQEDYKFISFPMQFSLNKHGQCTYTRFSLKETCIIKGKEHLKTEVTWSEPLTKSPRALLFLGLKSESINPDFLNNSEHQHLLQDAQKIFKTRGFLL